MGDDILNASRRCGIDKEAEASKERKIRIQTDSSNCRIEAGLSKTSKLRSHVVESATGHDHQQQHDDDVLVVAVYQQLECYHCMR